MVSLRSFVTATTVAAVAHASPAPLDLTGYGAPDVDLLVRKGLEEARSVERRMSTDFSIDKTWQDQTLFDGDWSEAQLDDAFSGNEKTTLAVICRDCYTKGMVTAHIVDDILHPTVKLEFNEVEAYVHLGVAVNSHQNFAINLYTSNTPAGMGFPGLTVGLVFFVDLVFDLTEEIELDTGFYVKLPNDAYLEAGIFEGDIQDSFFDGMAGKTLPVSVVVGKATIKAAIRLRVQCGVDIGFGAIGLGATAAVGVYANVIEFVTVIQTTPTCPLETEMWLDLNVGAYAKFDVVVNWETLGPAPTVSTTLLEAPNWTRCWIGGGDTAEPTKAINPYPQIAPGFSTHMGDDRPVSTSASWQSTPAYPTTYTATTKSPSTTITPAPTVPALTSGFRYPDQPLRSGGGHNVYLSQHPGRYTNSSLPAATDLVTSTVYSTTTYALRRCAVPGVMNCPMEFGRDITVTRTLDSFTTVCPYSESVTYPSSASCSGEGPGAPTPIPITDIRTFPGDVHTLRPCATPIKNTFVVPDWASWTAAAPSTPTGGGHAPWVPKLPHVPPFASSPSSSPFASESHGPLSDVLAQSTHDAPSAILEASRTPLSTSDEAISTSMLEAQGQGSDRASAVPAPTQVATSDAEPTALSSSPSDDSSHASSPSTSSITETYHTKSDTATPVTAGCETFRTGLSTLGAGGALLTGLSFLWNILR